MPFDGRLCDPCTAIELNKAGQREHSRMGLQGEPTRDRNQWVLTYRCFDCGTDWTYRVEPGPLSGFSRVGAGTPPPEKQALESPIEDPKRIDVSDPGEVAAWSTLLQISEAELQAAVDAVGPIAASVAVHLATLRRHRRDDP